MWQKDCILRILCSLTFVMVSRGTTAIGKAAITYNIDDKTMDKAKKKSELKKEAAI